MIWHNEVRNESQQRRRRRTISSTFFVFYAKNLSLVAKMWNTWIVKNLNELSLFLQKITENP